MDKFFESFKELIETGLSNNLPRDAKLIILGQILNSMTRNEITVKQARELEDMLGGRDQFSEALSYAIFGRLEQEDLAA
jgi:thiazole synthase